MDTLTAEQIVDSLDDSTDHVWYVAYGSNLSADRFDCYVAGGRPEGAARSYPGFRDPTPPQAEETVSVRGGIYFAGESTVWKGGTAFLCSELETDVAARAYLLTRGQFADLAAQEMLREPRADLDLSTVLEHRRHAYGEGRYETLLHLGEYHRIPMLTVSSPWTSASADLTAPTSNYLRMIGTGLQESHGWDSEDVGSYLADAPGASTAWQPGEIADLFE